MSRRDDLITQVYDDPEHELYHGLDRRCNYDIIRNAIYQGTLSLVRSSIKHDVNLTLGEFVTAIHVDEMELWNL